MTCANLPALAALWTNIRSTTQTSKYAAYSRQRDFGIELKRSNKESFLSTAVHGKSLGSSQERIVPPEDEIVRTTHVAVKVEDAGV